MRKLFGFLCGCLYLGCQTATHPKNALIDQIIKPRAGYQGKLTNRTCLQYDGAKCTLEDMSVYDINDELTRQKLNDLNFICVVAGQRYKVCLDRPGFCRKEVIAHCASWDILRLFCKYEDKWWYRSIDDYQFLIDSKLRCFNKDKYSFTDFQ